MTREGPLDAFLLCAGYGTRMRPLTDILPKPMVPLCGRPLLDYALDRLKEAGTRRVVVNLHHHAKVLELHLKKRKEPEIVLSPEETILETGGGAKKALPLIATDPFFMINGDSFWTDGPSGPALSRLAESFDPERMDVLLLLIPVIRMTLTKGVGDYDLDGKGQPHRSPGKTGGLMFTGLRVCAKRALRDTPEGPFPFLEVMDRAERKGRLFALVHDGDYHHISTPEDLERVEKGGVPGRDQET